MNIYISRINDCDMHVYFDVIENLEVYQDSEEDNIASTTKEWIHKVLLKRREHQGWCYWVYSKERGDVMFHFFTLECLGPNYVYVLINVNVIYIYIYIPSVKLKDKPRLVNV